MLKELLIKHEGLRLKPYRDTVGKLTIGVGRNLEGVGISQEEAFYLLDNDIRQVIQQLDTIPIYSKLDPQKQIALADMAFNLGFNGILKFKRMWAALETADYVTATREMLNSVWAEGAPNRAQALMNLMSKHNE